jgi:hypothetical protein
LRVHCTLLSQFYSNFFLKGAGHLLTPIYGYSFAMCNSKLFSRFVVTAVFSSICIEWIAQSSSFIRQVNAIPIPKYFYDLPRDYSKEVKRKSFEGMNILFFQIPCQNRGADIPCLPKSRGYCAPIVSHGHR